jgi:hypothetical protein
MQESECTGQCTTIVGQFALMKKLFMTGVLYFIVTCHEP